MFKINLVNLPSPLKIKMDYKFPEVLPVKLQKKEVQPRTVSQLVYPDSGFNGLSEVSVNAVTNEIDTNIKSENIKKNVSILGVQGSIEELKGTKIEITKNGTYTPEEPYNAFTEVKANMEPDLSEYFGGKLKAGNSSYYYSNLFENIKKIPLLEIEGTSCQDMFRGCKLLTTIPQLDTSKVTNMSRMFVSCPKLTTIPQLDTSNVTTMSTMFSNCSDLTAIPQLDTSKVTNMSSMFNSCSNLTTIPQLDTSKVTNMSDMFNSCSSLISIPELDTSKVTNMRNMFYGCRKIVNIPPLDKASCTNMNNMFNACEKLTIIPFADLNFDNISSVSNMFSNCYSLTSVGNLSFANTPNIERLFSCSYQDKSNLETIGNVYCPKATSLYNTFQNLSKLVSVGEITCEAATNVHDMFSDDKALQNIGGLINLGQAYSTTQSANNSYYTLNLSTSKLLTHDSLMNVINNLYDIATKGVKTQQLVLGSTNLAKLTADEIAIATSRGWSVS